MYQRQQELFDGRYTTFEIVKRKDASKVIMIDGDDILLTRQQQPGSRVYMSLLGGIVEE